MPLSTLHSIDIIPSILLYSHTTPNSSFGRHHRVSSLLAAPGRDLGRKYSSGATDAAGWRRGTFKSMGEVRWGKVGLTFAFITMCRAGFEVLTVITDSENLRLLFETCTYNFSLKVPDGGFWGTGRGSLDDFWEVGIAAMVFLFIEYCFYSTEKGIILFPSRFTRFAMLRFVFIMDGVVMLYRNINFFK